MLVVPKNLRYWRKGVGMNNDRSTAMLAGGSRGAPIVTNRVTNEVDRYTRSIAGVEIEAVCNGPLGGSNTVLSVSEPRLMMTASNVNMPLLSRTAMGDDTIAMTYVRAAPPGNHWCGFDLEPDSMLIYGPSAEHTAVTRPGLKWACAVTTVERLEEMAEDLGITAEFPARGEVRLIRRSPMSRAVGAALGALGDAAGTHTGNSEKRCDDVLHTMVRALPETYSADECGSRGLNSRVITARSIDYANEMGRVPSLSELCIAAHVSERRLRKAFVDEYQMAPARFFRTWALATARKRLLDNDPTHHSVADVAAGLGFFHLGRFASYYNQLYGEFPSSTLRDGRS